MVARQDREYIRVLVADDDERVLECYREAFGDHTPNHLASAIDALAAELFDPGSEIEDQPGFEIVTCSQGADAVDIVAAAGEKGEPFDVVILDVRMPPGIDGVAAGSAIREHDPDVEIVFVSGYSDVPFEELQRRVPPPVRLHYFNKPLSFLRLAEDIVSMVRAR